MSTMTERVSLPDPTSKPLLHPVDVAEARRLFVRAWGLSVLGSAEVLVLVAATAWLLSDSWLAPSLAVVSTGVIAETARRHLMTEAWAHIPRKRQDRQRPTPSPYSLVESVVRPIALTAGVVTALASLTSYDVGVRSWAVGSAAGLGLAMVGASLERWLRIRSAAAVLELTTGLVCVASAASLAVSARWVPSPMDLPVALLGGAVLLGVYLLWLYGTRVRRTGDQ